ncbi:MAG: tetraacyldisaccharide 4'-kinase [Burkholderiaceae bacterium]|jgi:tetraacyldisaccharide 4'-kinase
MAPGGRWLESAWSHRGWVSTLLLPLAALFSLLAGASRMSYRFGWRTPTRLPVPVIVVGNITVGGTGKTPLVISLIEQLRRAGRHPGLISRGYRGRYSKEVSWAEVEGHDATYYGDESVLVHARTGAPAAVGQARAQAAHELLTLYQEIDVLVCDDGLQHYALARDCEVAVVDDRGLGNGRRLPSGPLREGSDRLQQVDALMFNGPIDATLAKQANVPTFSMTLKAQLAYQLVAPGELRALSEFQGQKLAAFAGIGAPERFFAMLRSEGLSFDAVPLPDHFDFRVNPFEGRSEDAFLITEKDAVKCWHLRDARIWVAPVDALIGEDFVSLVLEKISERN